MKKQAAIAFKGHLDRIKLAKNTASLMEQMQLAEKSMGLLWEQLFDTLCTQEEGADLSPIKELAGVLNKMLTSYKHLFAIQQRLQGKPTDEKAWMLSENVLKEIEDQLQLL